MTTIKKNVKMYIPQALSPDGKKQKYMGYENEPVRRIETPEGHPVYLYQTSEGEYKLMGQLRFKTVLVALFVAAAGLVAANA